MNQNYQSTWGLGNASDDNYYVATATKNIYMLRQLLEGLYYNETGISYCVYTLKEVKYNLPPPSSEIIYEIDNLVQAAESLFYRLSEEDSKPKFNGDIIHWFWFWESFQREVHLVDNYSLGFKFACLKRRLEDEPLNMVLKLTSANAYFDAVSNLRTKYSDEKKLVEVHLNALLDLETPSSLPDPLLQFISDIEYHIRALKVYGTNVEESGRFIVAILNKKLPNGLRKSMEKEEGERYWTLPEFHDTLKKQIQLRLPKSRRSYVTTTIFSNAYHYSSSCQLCSGYHQLNGCEQYLTPEMKMDRATELGLCLICLNVCHITENCLFPQCTLCKGKHHISLCNLGQPSVVSKTQVVRTYNMGKSNFVNTTSGVKKRRRSCQLCSERHDISGCHLYKSSKEKMERAKSLRLCLLCIRDGHKTEDCTRRDWCKFCRGMHNSMLCHLHSEVKLNKKFKNDKFTCEFCSNTHFTLRCPLYIKRRHKIEKLSELGLCLKCVQKGHAAENCLRTNCPFCGEKHHRLLCLSNKPKKKNRKIFSGNHATDSCENRVVEQNATNSSEKGVVEQNVTDSSEKGVVEQNVMESSESRIEQNVTDDSERRVEQNAADSSGRRVGQNFTDSSERRAIEQNDNDICEKRVEQNATDSCEIRVKEQNDSDGCDKE